MEIRTWYDSLYSDFKNTKKEANVRHQSDQFDVREWEAWMCVNASLYVFLCFRM